MSEGNNTNLKALEAYLEVPKLGESLSAARLLADLTGQSRCTQAGSLSERLTKGLYPVWARMCISR